MGFSEVILVLLTLSGLGVSQNANAPSAADVNTYAPEAADVMVYADVEAVLPSNWALLQKLPDDENVKKAPELRTAIATGLATATAALDGVKQQYGVDPINDVKTVAAWVIFQKKGDPQFLVAVRGTFPADLTDKLAKENTEDKVETIDKRSLLVDKDGDKAMGIGADGTLLFGSPDLVRKRMAAKWKAVKVKKGAIVERATPILDEKPVFMVALAPGANFVAHLDKELKPEEDAAFLYDALTGQEFSAVAVAYNGISWTYRAKTSGGYDRAAMASEGLIDLIRASHLLIRGGVRVALAAVDSYASANKDLAAIVKHKADLIKLVEQWSGDGKFDEKVDNDPKTKVVSVKLTGTKLSDVLSLGVWTVPGALVFMTARAKHEDGGMEESSDSKPAEIKPIKPVKPKKKK